MNIYGLNKKLKMAREMLKKELNKKDKDRKKIEKIKEGMNNLNNKIKLLKKQRSKK